MSVLFQPFTRLEPVDITEFRKRMPTYFNYLGEDKGVILSVLKHGQSYLKAYSLYQAGLLDIPAMQCDTVSLRKLKAKYSAAIEPIEKGSTRLLWVKKSGIKIGAIGKD